VIFGDRIFPDQSYFDTKFVEQNIQMLTPVKLLKGEAQCIREREKAYRDLYSASVSKVRQPVESFFNWINEKTQIQNAQKVRSINGLAVHVFGKIAAAFIFLIF
jgi:vacuolar-type H+-ATPase subunit D/Vma8